VSNNEEAQITTTEPIHDLYLRMLISVLEHDGSTDSSMAITLSTNSGVITGQLITRDTWKALWSTQLEGATGNGAELMKTFIESVDKAIDELNEEEGAEDQDPVRRFIHLKDATMFVPGADRLSLPLWRGRLESVAGWTLGNFK
jgi:hypothetical protein